jgi:hypothetical protein
MRYLIIGGIEVPLKASYGLSQDYEPVQAVNRPRMMDGSLKQQTAWSGKLKTVISGNGNMPPGIDTLDYSSAITIQCIAEQAVSSVSNLISVPSARRADYGVEGRALVAGVWQSTPVSLSVDTATLTIVPGATLYQAVYWPELVCYCDPPSQKRNARTSSYSWQIQAEEI